MEDMRTENRLAAPPQFYWTAEAWGTALRCEPLAAAADHLFTTRQLQLPAGGDRQGWAPLAEALGVDAPHLILVRQVHGNHVLVVREAGDARVTAPPDADAIVTKRRDVALAVRVADCVPLLMADPATGAVAAVHAGWRGTATSAARAAVTAMIRELGVEPASIVAAAGPSIGPCCYRVGSDVREAFEAAGHDRRSIERWFPAVDGERRLDLWQATLDQLSAAGLARERIHLARLCTACRIDLFYSFRAEGRGTGRLAAAIRGRRPATPGG
jgi:YfiH family protein